MNRPKRFPFSIAFAALILCLSACAHLASPHEKQVSFHRFESFDVSGTKLSDYLELRTALVVGGAEPVLINQGTQDLDIRLRPVAKDGFDIGSATCVSADGYFLTAGHCVLRRPLNLLVVSGSEARVFAARVVWSPPTGSSCDLSLLHIESSTPTRFDFASPDRILADSDVVTFGANGLAGGKILATSAAIAPATPTTPSALAVFHNAPLAEGDSGGPLTTTTGQLIGIEVLARRIFLGPTQGIALCPDPDWLKKTIITDRPATLLSRP